MIASLLRKTDQLVAQAIELVMRGGLAASTGMPTEMVLTTEGNRTLSDARMLTQAAEVLARMPWTFARFKAGMLSWGQVRGIVCAMSRLRVAEHEEIDRFIARCAPGLSSADADTLVQLVDEEVLRRRPDLVADREDRSVRHNRLILQATIDGGADIWGHADAHATATLSEALDHMADRPVPIEQDGPCRQEQHLEALVRMAEAVLSGRTGGAAARPTLYATFDIAGLSDEARSEGIALLSRLTGRPVRMTSVSRDILLCDSHVVPVIVAGARVIGIGRGGSAFSDAVRTAIVVRDRRCRFCRRAPAAHCDAHHIIPGVGSSAEDGILLCRPCHRRVHRCGWTIRWLPDGFAEFRRGSRRVLSAPP